MSESDLYPKIMGAWSRGACRLFRQQSGLSWQGTVVEHTATRLILAHPRAIRSGVPGMSDLGGMIATEILVEDVGKRMAVAIAIEVKAGRGRLTPEQAAYIDMVRRLGGRAGTARSIEDAGQIIAGVEL